ncbi:hypothetical protein LX36DRAFT_675194 [Colletotrichum falcatum]|nr:hypothetical protein LX36DRAFT_675194 [Colletotrichum falcatum]
MWFANVVLVLALGCRAAVARIVIGYRVVSQAEAAEINKINRPFRDPNYEDTEGWSQLGNGVYTSPRPAGWIHRERDWHCAIKADEHRFAAASKAWIPYDDYYGNQMWNRGERAISDYIDNSLHLDSDKTLRLSYVAGHGLNVQMLIPTAMVNSDALDFYAQCFRTKEELQRYSDEVVDYDRWPNVIGYKGDPR